MGEKARVSNRCNYICKYTRSPSQLRGNANRAETFDCSRHPENKRFETVDSRNELSITLISCKTKYIYSTILNISNNQYSTN